MKMDATTTPPKVKLKRLDRPLVAGWVQVMKLASSMFMEEAVNTVLTTYERTTYEK